SQRLGAMEHRGADEPADASARAAGGADAVHAPADRIPFLAPGAGYANRAQQPDPDRAGAGADLLPDATRGQLDLSGRDRALSAGAGRCARIGGTRGTVAAPLHVEVRAGKRSGAVSRTGAGRASGAR